MVTQLQVSEEELADLRGLLAEELDESRAELHHTDKREYRADVRLRVTRLEALLHKIEGLLPAGIKP